MNRSFSINGAGAINATPLIGFDVIIDKDISLIHYILKYIRNENVFDLDKIKREYTFFKLIEELYNRTYENPLYLLMKNEADKEFLDECYKEFEETEEYLDEVSVATDFYSLIENFLLSGEINPIVMCKNEKEQEIISSDPTLKKLQTILYSEFTKRKFDKYGQIYLRRIEDIDRFIEYKFTYVSCYFSSCALNLNETKDNIRMTDSIDQLIKLRNQINIFDMYKPKNIRRELN